MKIDLDPQARGYIRGLLLERAAQSLANGELAKKDNIKAEWRDEAAYASELAMIVDAGENEREPARVEARRDLDSVDAPTKEN